MKRLFFYTVALIFSATAFSQTIVRINDKDISKDEFEYYYHKNGTEGGDTLSVESYLDMFIDFKLKVEEAYAQHLDTATSLKKELEGYRSQLVAPYLTDTELKEKLVEEEMERMKKNVKISHILFRVENPSDTTAAYNKAVEVMAKATPENFSELASEYSEDPSAQYNKGEMGWCSAMQFIYPFETAAWNAAPGTITGPVRTRFGYHIIYVQETRSDIGEIKVAHILRHKPQIKDSASLAEAHKVVEEIRARIVAGEDFAAMAALYSEDNNAVRGGELPWITPGSTNEYFENAAFSLSKPGEISGIVEAPYGWHIIMLIGKRDLEIGNAQRARIESYLRNDDVNRALHTSFINKLKKEYKFKLINNKKTIAKFANQKLTRTEYESYCKSHPGQNDQLNEFIDQSIYNYENSILETKYPEFGMLMKEYKDGILLFEVSNKEVWQKAAADNEGLREMFSKDPDKYRWNEPRFRGQVIYCANADVRDKAIEMVGHHPDDKTETTHQISSSMIIEEDSIAAVLTRTFNNGETNIKVEKGLFIKGKNQVVDALMFNTGAIPANVQFPYVFVVGRLDNRPRNYREAKGLVTNDYQEILSAKWRNKLRAKYPVKIYQKVVDSVK